MKSQKLKVKSQKLILLFLIFFIISLVFPFVSLAGTYNVCDNIIYRPNDPDPNRRVECVNPREATYDGLVPCGKEVKVSGINDPQKIPCQFCHLFVMFDGIIKFILTLVIIIAVLMFVVGGFMFLTAGASPTNVNRAKSIITSTVWGLVIIFAAWIIVNTFLIFLGVASWTGFFDNPATTGKEGWFKINCPISIGGAGGGSTGSPGGTPPTVKTDTSGPATACNVNVPFAGNESRYALWNGTCDGKKQAAASGGIGQGCCESACGTDSQCDEQSDTGNCQNCQYTAPLPIIPSPGIAPYCVGFVSSATISWEEAGRGTTAYVVDVDNDGDWGNGFWNKVVSAGTFSTNGPDGFRAFAGASGWLEFQAGSTYYVRVYYPNTKEHTPTASFITQQCP